MCRKAVENVLADENLQFAYKQAVQIAPSLHLCVLAGMRVMRVLKDLAAAYTGCGKLPAPHPLRVGSAAQVVHAAQLIGEAVPGALLDPRLAQPISEVSYQGYRSKLCGNV